MCPSERTMLVTVRLVLDTATLVAAVRSSTGASNLLLRAALEVRYALLLSVPLVLEYEAVLTREEHLTRSGLSRAEMQALVDALVNVAEPVRLAFRWRSSARDPDDDMVLEAAANGRADALITFNRRDFAEIAARFGIRVLSPKQAWEEVCKG